MLALVADDKTPPDKRIQRVRQLFNAADVFEQAHRLVDKHQQRAEAIADQIEPEHLRRLFYYLIDTVLDRPAEAEPTLVPATLLSSND